MSENITQVPVEKLGMDQIYLRIQLTIKEIFDKLAEIKLKANTEEQKESVKNIEELFSGISKRTSRG